jgi:hypothetical protein
MEGIKLMINTIIILIEVFFIFGFPILLSVYLENKYYGKIK